MRRKTAERRRGEIGALPGAHAGNKSPDTASVAGLAPENG